MAEEDLEDLYENAPCGYISLGPDGRIVKSNLTLSKWVGFSRDDLIGKHLRDLLNIAGAIFYETHIAPLLRMQGHFDEVALDLITATGAKLAVITNALERRDGDGNLLFTRVTILQATERRRYERGLVEARNAADLGLREEKDKSAMRERFVAVLGHDLRNPLAGIGSGLRIIQRKGPTAATPAMIELMLRSVDRMKGLVDNVLDLTRSRIGGGLLLQIDRGHSVGPTLTQVIEELRIVHLERSIDVRLDVTQPVDCDHARIGQLLSNLLANALTHGAKDVPIGVWADTVGGEFKLAVVNGGEPIPAATMERLFQPFYRGDASSSSSGLGLGLYIASEIAKAHGGTLTASSDEKETVFSLAMPVAQPG